MNNCYLSYNLNNKFIFTLDCRHKKKYFLECVLSYCWKCRFYDYNMTFNNYFFDFLSKLQRKNEALFRHRCKKLFSNTFYLILYVFS